MNKKLYALTVAELRRSKQVCRGSSEAFAKWLVNYFIPQVQFNFPRFSEAQARRLIKDVL